MLVIIEYKNDPKAKTSAKTNIFLYYIFIYYVYNVEDKIITNYLPVSNATDPDTHRASAIQHWMLLPTKS